MKKQSGKLIVIDGIDGSGKATQTELLRQRLVQVGRPVKTIDFPRYDSNFFGQLIGRYLTGRYGDFIEVDPRLASVLYAADRFESADQIRQWLKAGYLVLADRYVSANQIHQGSKIADPKKRQVFINWLAEMEHGVFKLPYPDLVIYLDVPFEVSRAWLDNKVAKRRKAYLKGRRDVAEDNLLHLKAARRVALSLEKKNDQWVKIRCCQKTACLTPAEVAERVWQVVNDKFKLSADRRRLVK